jgi:hypothetical protein
MAGRVARVGSYAKEVVSALYSPPLTVILVTSTRMTNEGMTDAGIGSPCSAAMASLLAPAPPAA